MEHPEREVVATTASSQPQKLKDSCDQCSASKVRCNKQKPACERCQKLGHSCFYSPARRVGRPYRPKESSEESRDEPDGRPPVKPTVKATRFVDESVRLHSRFNALPTTVETGHNDGPRGYDLRTNSQMADQLGHPDGGNHSNNMEQDSDCALVAMDLIHKLEIASKHLHGPKQINSELLSTTTQTITSAFRQISLVLVCPCSERPEVGMLVAAVCMAVVDMHGITIAKSARDQSTLGTLDATGPWESQSMGIHSSTDHGVTAVRVLGELSKLAKVVLQLTQRYNNEDGDGGNTGDTNTNLPEDLLPALAGFLRERLQQITIDATYWLA